ncbi:hypothetical protein PHJA_001403400 [Phtheirospermum japonicum]|uniref:Late embryogenesis abundant protein LEA-2 subgroup domain-containing protein n=1 Tax=Phtheirospermum japonicum TaxID=374723 RepID=A0A830C368_9LAMI|nr:hypothetical protein PHJA_001403400 [Phtheirospermum japonicum]
MSEKKEQVEPLAPVAHRPDIEEAYAFPEDFMIRRHQRCIKWGGCSFALLLIIVMVLLVLMLTVFHVKDPDLNISYVNLQGLNNRTDIDRGLNTTIEADVSIKNPNVASFKFSNMTMSVHYNGSVIGVTRAVSGEVRARRTLRMNFPIKLRADEILQVGRLESDLSTGIMPISSYTWISGEVKISGGIKRSLIVRMNCTMNVNITSQRIQGQNCRRRT